MKRRKGKEKQKNGEEAKKLKGIALSALSRTLHVYIMKQFKEKKTARKCSHKVSENSSLQLFISSRSPSLSLSPPLPPLSPSLSQTKLTVRFKFAFCVFFLQVGGCCCVFISLHVVSLYLRVYSPRRKIVVMLRLIRALQRV